MKTTQDKKQHSTESQPSQVEREQNQNKGYSTLGHFLKSKPLYKSLFDKDRNQSFELGYN